jgi:hypothetical protein
MLHLIMYMNFSKLPALAVASHEAGQTAAHENEWALHTFKNFELTSSLIKKKSHVP